VLQLKCCSPTVSKLVLVRFGDLAVHEDFAVGAVRWEATGPGGALFPVPDADIRLTRAGDDVTVLEVSGVYRPPLGNLGAELDRVMMHRVAQARPRTFTHHIGAAITDPAVVPDAEDTGRLPYSTPWLRTEELWFGSLG